MACAFGAALLFVLCNPWTGRPELRHRAVALDAAHVQNGLADLSLASAHASAEMNGVAAMPVPPPSYNEAVRTDNVINDVKEKDKDDAAVKRRVDFSSSGSTGSDHSFDSLTFAYATGFYDPYVPSSYYLSYTDSSEY